MIGMVVLPLLSVIVGSISDIIYDSELNSGISIIAIMTSTALIKEDIVGAL